MALVFTLIGKALGVVAPLLLGAALLVCLLLVARNPDGRVDGTVQVPSGLLSQVQSWQGLSLPSLSAPLSPALNAFSCADLMQSPVVAVGPQHAVVTARRDALYGMASTSMVCAASTQKSARLMREQRGRQRRSRASIAFDKPAWPPPAEWTHPSLR